MYRIDEVLGALGAHSKVPSDKVPYADLGTPPIFLGDLNFGESVDHGGNHYEIVMSSGVTVPGYQGYVKYRFDDEKVFGVAVVRETEDKHLYDLTYQVFRDIFAVMEKSGTKRLWRVWNYIPGINNVVGEERYRMFNAGRFQAFEDAKYSCDDGSPASCALGSDGQDLVICFLAGNHETLNIENPRQVSAYHYPKQYGQKPPLFSRASLIKYPTRDEFMISGTASIVGSSTVHVGDVEMQTHETLRNIETLMTEANKSARNKIVKEDLVYKVYVRDTADFFKIKTVVDQHLGGCEVIYVKADVCRADLLVEIEASSKNVLTYGSLLE